MSKNDFLSRQFSDPLNCERRAYWLVFSLVELRRALERRAILDAATHVASETAAKVLKSKSSSKQFFI
jgi:hypothetical protein